ncbi:MAG TPA: hypothetical protein VFJ43_14450 [Bacteroidia bacterium]|nr:hypothetical protein [Bacteroidia bacterium]
MKRLFIPVIASMLFATACEKNELPSPAPLKTTSNNTTHSGSRQFVDFNYTLYKNPTTGDYSCPTPKTDCSKITPDPLLSLTPIDDAISTGKVQDFFNQSNWADKFPYLDDQTSVVSGLQNGDYTMIRKTNSAGEILYIVIPSTDDPGSFDTAIYTTLVTNQ